mmetsp:Transcript_118747/g.335938  ORF Transcript_118747/g.335938 Transcript_118747/m.335938 type:complete len:172 (+) Transcript_118747:2-517(+)
MVPRKQDDRGPKLAFFVQTALCPVLAQLEVQLSQMGREGRIGFSASGFSSADLAVFDFVMTMEQAIEPTAFESVMRSHGRIQELVALIGAQPEIQKHLQRYPYKDMRPFFAAPDAATRGIQAFLLPVMKAVLGAKIRYGSHARDLIVPAVLFSAIGGLVGYCAAVRGRSRP